jgi:hypothetical protein
LPAACARSKRSLGPPRPKAMTSPSCSDWRETRSPFTNVPLVLPRSSSHHWPASSTTSACRLDASRSS